MLTKLRLSILSLITILCCAHGNVYAQKAATIDSLQRALISHSADDTVKFNILSLIGHQYHSLNADSEYHYGKKLMALATKIRYEYGEVVAYEILGSAKFVTGEYDSCIIYTQKGLSKCKSYYHSQISVLLNNIGNALARQGKYNNALEYYDSATTYATKAGNVDIVARAQSNVGNIYYRMGNYSHALKNYVAGLKMQEKLGKTSEIAADLANVANVYFRLFQYEQALDYNTRSMQLNKKIGDKTNLITNYNTYAMIYDAQKKYDSSLVSLKTALELARETKDVYTENIVNTNIAEWYMKQGRYAEALPLYLQAVTMSEKLGDIEGLAIAKAGAGEVLLKQGNTTKAISFLAESYKSITEAGIKEQALNITQLLGDAYQQAGNYKEALHYLRINIAYRDSVNRSKARQDAQQSVFNYELQKKEAVIDLMKQNEDILQSKDRFKNLLLFTFLLGACMAAIAAYLFMLNVRKLNKNREVLKHQKNEIEQQARKLQDMNDFKDNTFNVLSHDLRSPVNALTSAMMLLDEKVITPEEFAMHRHELNSKLQSVSLLLENMLYWARAQMKGEETLNITRLSVKNKALRVMAVLKDAAQQKNIQLTYDINDQVHAYADYNQLDIILRNLTSNAIKFTPSGGSVVISAREDGLNTLISVTDSGVGMTTEQINALFKDNIHTSTQGTSGERGTGLGLQLSNKFAKNNGGSINVVSKPGKGTTFTLILPNTVA